MKTVKTELKFMNSQKRIAADIAECALFVALMVAAAFIKIPFPVPLTFQTVVSVLAGLLLGAKKGAAAMAVYAFMGLAGLPVFAAGGGIYYIFKPSFGYIPGFIAAAAVAGAVAGRANLPLWRYILAATVAFLANYLIGVPYCMVCAKIMGVENLANLLVTGNLIYMPKDAALSVLAAVVARKILPVLGCKIKNAKKG